MSSDPAFETKEEVRSLRITRAVTDLSYRELAEVYDVSDDAARHAAKGETYTAVEMPAEVLSEEQWEEAIQWANRGCRSLSAICRELYATPQAVLDTRTGAAGKREQILHLHNRGHDAEEIAWRLWVKEESAEDVIARHELDEPRPNVATDDLTTGLLDEIRQGRLDATDALAYLAYAHHEDTTPILDTHKEPVGSGAYRLRNRVEQALQA